MRQTLPSHMGAPIAGLLVGLVALIFLLVGTPGLGAVTLATAALVYGLWRSQWRSGETTFDSIPEVQALSPEEAMQLSPGQTVRDGQDRLTVQDTGRDPRRQTEAKVIVIAVDKNGKEWGLPITERTVGGPSPSPAVP